MNELGGRLENFSISIVAYCRSNNKDLILRPILTQLLRSGTSVGANYHESQNGISRKDFRAKIYICLKEAQETKYWLRILDADKPHEATKALLDEADQLTKILQSIANKTG